jgi:hypothetical protein
LNVIMPSGAGLPFTAKCEVSVRLIWRRGIVSASHAVKLAGLSGPGERLVAGSGRKALGEHQLFW